ncbi:MAG TPA: gas vesicle protein K [Gemmatimonadaceae bacterium]
MSDERVTEVTRGTIAEFERELREIARALPERIDADPEHVEQGLARLVLTLIEVLRKVLEHQAVRRMDGGSLSDEEVERLGLALLRLSERMDELKRLFGLADEDLEIDLGPLGRLR